MNTGVGRGIVMLSYDFRGNTVHDRKEFEWKLARDGYTLADSFLIICWSKKRETIQLSDRILVESLPAFLGKFRALYDILFVFVAPGIARRHRFKPDIISIAEFPLVWGARAVKRALGGEIILRLIGLPRDIAKTRSIFHYWYVVANEALAGRIPDRCVAINDATRQYAIDRGIPANHVSILPLDSIRADGALVADAPKGAAKKELGIPSGVPIILSVGRLEPEKAFDELISVFAKSGIEARLVIVGEGVLRSKLEAQAREQGVGERVIFAGKKSRREIWSYYKDADAFALLSKSEGLGLVFWEAMHVGTPVIGRPIGGIKETIGEDGLRGFFWNTEDGPVAFGAKLKRCFEKGDVQAMTERARDYVSERIGITPSV